MEESHRALLAVWLNHCRSPASPKSFPVEKKEFGRRGVMLACFWTVHYSMYMQFNVYRIHLGICFKFSYERVSQHEVAAVWLKNLKKLLRLVVLILWVNLPCFGFIYQCLQASGTWIAFFLFFFPLSKTFSSCSQISYLSKSEIPRSRNWTYRDHGCDHQGVENTKL